MRKLLTICPTRRRPDRLAEMLDSFHATRSEWTDIIVYISNDEDYLEGYKKVIGNTPHIIGDPIFLVQVLNILSTGDYSCYEYYQEVNDDHVYITPQWDDYLIKEIEGKGKGWGIACGEDGVDDDWYHHRHPSAAIISGNIVRTLGYFVYPKIQHLCTDMYLRDLGEGIGKLFHKPGISIEHRHIHNGKAKKDANYQWVYSDASNVSKEGYKEWRDKYKQSDILKINKAIENEINCRNTN